MKLLGAIVALLAVGPLSAQYWSVGGFGNVAFPGLGHAPAGPHPYGNVTFPAVPQGSAAFSRNASGVARGYGALVPGFGSNQGRGNGAGRGNRRGNNPGIYAFPVFIGGYGYAQPDQPLAEQPNDAAPNPPAAPPVVINQYFGTAAPGQEPPPDAASSNFHYYQSPANNDAAPGDSTYYLIAFKDHTVYSAVAYYTEGDTLHYFTSGNTHNQVSVSLVDRPLTEQLNRARNVTVRLP